MDPRAVVGLGKRRGEDDWPVRRLYCAGCTKQAKAHLDSSRVLALSAACNLSVRTVWASEKGRCVCGASGRGRLCGGSGWIVLAWGSRPATKLDWEQRGGRVAGERGLALSLERRGRAASRVPEKENDKDPISAAVGFIGQAL